MSYVAVPARHFPLKDLILRRADATMPPVAVDVRLASGNSSVATASPGLLIEPDVRSHCFEPFSWFRPRRLAANTFVCSHKFRKATAKEKSKSSVSRKRFDLEFLQHRRALAFSKPGLGKANG